MKKLLFVLFVVLGIFVGVIVLQSKSLKNVKSDRDVYKSNTTTLLQDVEKYRTSDSLNAVSIGQLELKIVEYAKYRAEDYRLIESLRVDKKRLESVVTTQTESIYKLEGTVRDSIVFRDNFIIDTLRCINIADKWFDLSGCIDADSKFAGRFENRDSLLYVEHIVPKRFWFIKWGTKERRQEIVSRNPHTAIVGAEYITIRK